MGSSCAAGQRAFHASSVLLSLPTTQSLPCILRLLGRVSVQAKALCKLHVPVGTCYMPQPGASRWLAQGAVPWAACFVSLQTHNTPAIAHLCSRGSLSRMSSPRVRISTCARAACSATPVVRSCLPRAPNPMRTLRNVLLNRRGPAAPPHYSTPRVHLAGSAWPVLRAHTPGSRRGWTSTSPQGAPPPSGPPAARRRCRAAGRWPAAAAPPQS